MTEKAHSEQFERVRSAFDQLKIEDRAVFLVEATVATVAQGIDQAGRAMGVILEDLFKSRTPYGSASTVETGGPGPQASARPTSEDAKPHDADAPDAHTET